jgi:hypothetical protein
MVSSPNTITISSWPKPTSVAMTARPIAVAMPKAPPAIPKAGSVAAPGEQTGRPRSTLAASHPDIALPSNMSPAGEGRESSSPRCRRLVAPIGRSGGRVSLPRRRSSIR